MIAAAPNLTEWPIKNARRPRRNRRGLGLELGRFLNGNRITDMHKPEPLRIGSGRDNRQLISLLAIHGEASGFPIVADQGIGAPPGSRTPGRVPYYRGHNASICL